MRDFAVLGHTRRAWHGRACQGERDLPLAAQQMLPGMIHAASSARTSPPADHQGALRGCLLRSWLPWAKALRRRGALQACLTRAIACRELLTEDPAMLPPIAAGQNNTRRSLALLLAPVCLAPALDHLLVPAVHAIRSCILCIFSSSFKGRPVSAALQPCIQERQA